MAMKRATGLCAFLLAIAAATLPADAQQRVLRWANNGEISTMDPHGAFSTANASLLGNIYEPLVRQDRDLKLEPALATSWKAITPQQWRFTIRQGVKFHDGSALTAEDVVQSLKRASSPESPYLSATHMISDAVKVDDFTVDVLLRGPYPILINDLSGVGILSAEWMQKHNAFLPADPAKGRTAYTSLNANGTGPFKLVSRHPDAETVLEKFEGWWDKVEHNLDRVIYQPVANDATRVAALLSGQIDLITPMPVQDIDRIKQSQNAKIVEVQDLRVMYISFNVSPERVPEGQSANPLAKREVREALATAIDVNAITSRVMRGLTKPTSTIIAAEVQGYDPVLAVPRAQFNQERSKELLAQAGYPQGFKIGMDCPVDRFINGEQVCQAVAAMWARIGVQANLTMMRYPAFMQKSLGGESDTFFMGWANTPQIDAFSILNNVFHTRTGRRGTWNAGRFSNPELDELVEKISTEMDRPKRQELLIKAFKLEAAQFATMPLYREPMLLAMRRNLDVPGSADGKMRLWLVRQD